MSSTILSSCLSFAFCSPLASSSPSHLRFELFRLSSSNRLPYFSLSVTFCSVICFLQSSWQSSPPCLISFVPKKGWYRHRAEYWRLDTICDTMQEKMGKLSLLAFGHSDEHKHKRMFTRAILDFVSADFCNMFFLSHRFFQRHVQADRSLSWGCWLWGGCLRVLLTWVFFSFIIPE